ncbi:MAG: cyanophycinase [Gemmatimonadaceae bacterium]
MPRSTDLRRRYSLVAVLLCWALCVPGTILAQRPAPGPLVIVGGGTQPPALVEEFLRLAGGAGRARIVVFAQASATGATSGEEKAAQLRAMGAEARNLWITRAEADHDSVVRLLDGVTGIWFGGGDQNRLIAALRGTRVEAALHARHAAGAVVGGTSAGAAVLSTPMITGTELRPTRDSTESWTRVQRGTVQVDSGFGFVRTAIIDQHFLRRKRHNRLLSLVLSAPPYLGAGIDEGTAIIVEPSGRWRIAGASSVLIVDARDAQRSSPDAPVLGASGVRLHLLSHGATFDPESGKATPPPTQPTARP